MDTRAALPLTLARRRRTPHTRTPRGTPVTTHHHTHIALTLGLAAAAGCSVIIQSNPGQTIDQARAAAEEQTSVRLCAALETPNIGFEDPTLPPQMTFNSYQSITGWRSPRGEPLVGRGNVDLPLVPDNAAYGAQHGLLKPRTTSGASEQPNTAYEYDLHVTPGQRYALVFSTASAAAGTDLTLTLSDTDVAPFTFAVRTSWYQRVVPFTPTGDTVTVRFQTSGRSDVGSFTLGRGEVDVYLDVAGVFAACASEAVPE